MSSSECLVLYAENADFKEYVDKYTSKHQISREAAFNHVLVQNVGQIYKCVQSEKEVIKNLSQGVPQDIKRMNAEPEIKDEWEK